MLKWLLSVGPLSKYGERFGGSQTSDFKGLTDELARLKAAKQSDPFAGTGGGAYDAFKAASGPFQSAYPQGGNPQAQPFQTAQAPTAEPAGPQNPLDRIKDAFTQLKGMHNDDSNSGPSPLDNAQWPAGPVGAPSQAQAQAPNAAAHVPMSMSRPPQLTNNPFSDFFARNTAMMRDPVTGEFIDPQTAAKFGKSGILNGLFG